MNDLLLLVSFAAIRNLSSLYHYVEGIDFAKTCTHLGCYTLVVGYLYWTRFKKNISTQSTVSDSKVERPLFFPSKTSHVRFFPKRHAFSHSYLLVGIPIGWQGSVGLLSVDDPEVKTWFSVNAENYLDRGDGHLGLKGKLQKYLKDEGLNPEEYPYAYLFTQPRFLSYFNNPVSFWYLYDSNRKLKAMILEVNNTFEERRAYLLTPDTSKSNALDDPSEIPPTTPSLHKSAVFSETWAKDFHVSPFSSRKGFYTLNTSDPLYPSMSCIGAMSGTITLLSSKSHVKLVARIFSEGPPVDPSTMNVSDKIRFLIEWWWIVYMTFPRVAIEAVKLWFKGLYVWSRPEPRKTTQSREATGNEAALESHFRSYLQFLVNNCQKPLAVTYVPCGIKAAATVTFKSPSSLVADDEEPSALMTIKVLTPKFYTRFVHYKNDLEAFSCESLESKTIEIQCADLLPSLLFEQTVHEIKYQTWSDAFIFEAVKKMRRNPKRIEEVSFIGKKDHDGKAPSKRNNSTTEEKEDIGASWLSSMDAWVLGKCVEGEKRSYRWEVSKIFIADKIAMGDVGLLGTEWWVVKTWVLWWVAGWLRL